MAFDWFLHSFLASFSPLSVLVIVRWIFLKLWSFVANPVLKIFQWVFKDLIPLGLCGLCTVQFLQPPQLPYCSVVRPHWRFPSCVPSYQDLHLCCSFSFRSLPGQTCFFFRLQLTYLGSPLLTSASRSNSTMRESLDIITSVTCLNE